jgi:hypothetical protein
METDAVRVAANRPNQDDVSHEGASSVGLHRDVTARIRQPLIVSE